MLLYGRITITDDPDAYGDRATKEEAVAIAEQLRTRLRSYIDTEYPGNAIGIHSISEGRDGVWGDEGEEREDIEDEIQREQERIVNEIGRSPIPG